MTDLRLFDIQYRRDDKDPQYAWEIHNCFLWSNSIIDSIKDWDLFVWEYKTAPVICLLQDSSLENY